MMRPLDLRASLLFGALGLALVSSTAACGDKGADDTGKSGPTDEDGDGTIASEDCDDSDPLVYPGAEDAWYDGVDSDCAGDDDYDADGDGVRSADHGGADCDDTDPAISPAATETWYDGVDGDCRGDNDYDADVDGFDAASAGGTDCDDNDPTTWPGAADTWYDGVDSDCDGASDHDADADGHDSVDGGGDDCNDGNADINPDATETWYDAVDSDCAGDDDYDADGDGASSAEYGGDDCDDADDETWPGAPEQLDGHDTDCDGTADHYSVEADYGGTYILGGEEDGYLGLGLAVADADGDGRADILASQTADAFTSAAGDGIVHLFYGSSLGSSPTTTSAADASIATTATSGPASALAFLGDQGGDGQAELVVGAPQASIDATDTGGVYLISSGGISGAGDLDDAGLVIRGPDTQSGFGSTVLDAGDLNGDGVSDLLVGAPQGDTVGVFLSGSLGGSGVISSEDADAVWSGDGESKLGSALAAVGDLDGDGKDDVLVGAPSWDASRGAALLVLGSTAPGTGAITSLATVALTGENEGDRFGAAVAAGDMDGDGIPDLAAGAPYQTTRIGRVHVVSGAGLTPGSHGVATVSYADFIGGTTSGFAGQALASGGDVNGDGKDDMVIGGPGASSAGSTGGAAWIEVSGRLGSRALADADVSFVGGSGADWAGFAVGLGDIDGDGRADSVVTVPGEDNLGNEGAIYIGYAGW